MRSFEEFSAEHEMSLEPRSGTRARFMTVSRWSSASPRRREGLEGIVYRGPRARSWARAYGEIVDACSKWVEHRPGLASWVSVHPIEEVGSDFVVWEHTPWPPSLSNFNERDSGEVPMDAPPGLEVFMAIVSFFLSDDEYLQETDPAHIDEERAAWDHPDGAATELERIAIARALVRESLQPDASATCEISSGRGDRWLIRLLQLEPEVLDRWADLS